MKVQIDSRNDNPLLGRVEIKYSVKEVQATPSRKEVAKQIAALTNSKEELVVVDVFDTDYGTSEFGGTAKIYKDKKELEKTELKHIVVRNFGKTAEDKKADAEKSEEKKEEDEKKQIAKDALAEENKKDKAEEKKDEKEAPAAENAEEKKE